MGKLSINRNKWPLQYVKNLQILWELYAVDTERLNFFEIETISFFYRESLYSKGCQFI